MEKEEKKHLNTDHIETKSREEIVSFFLSSQEEVLEKNKEIEALNRNLQSTNNDLKLAKEIIKQLQDKLYGKKTEKTEALKGQLSLLFDEVEMSADEDVFEREPIDSNNRLLKMDNVVLTPHVAYKTEEALSRRMEITVKNIADFGDGKKDNRVD